jgi:uncharacterized protein YihD (DUF1040 family)
MDESRSVDSVNKYWQERHAIDSKYVDSMAAVDASKDTVINNLQTQLSLTRTNLKIADHRANDLVEIIQSHADTPSKLMACDSLAVLVQQYSFQVGTLTELTDSIISQYTKKLEIRQDVLTRLEDSYNTQNKVLAENTKAYDGLYKDYNKVVKANKFNKTLSRILGVTVLVLGGALILK